MGIYRFYFDNDCDNGKIPNKRILLRYYEKLGLNKMIVDGVPYLLCVEKDGHLMEVFTGNLVYYEGRKEKISDSNSFVVSNYFTLEESLIMQKNMLNVLMDMKHFHDMVISSKRDIMDDKLLQDCSSEDGLTSINPCEKDMNGIAYTKSKR